MSVTISGSWWSQQQIVLLDVPYNIQIKNIYIYKKKHYYYFFDFRIFFFLRSFLYKIFLRWLAVARKYCSCIFSSFFFFIFCSKQKQSLPACDSCWWIFFFLSKFTPFLRYHFSLGKRFDLIFFNIRQLPKTYLYINFLCSDTLSSTSALVLNWLEQWLYGVNCLSGEFFLWVSFGFGTWFAILSIWIEMK